MKTDLRNCIVRGTCPPELYHEKPYPRGDRRFIMTRTELMRFNWCPQGWILGSDEDGGTAATEFGQVVETIRLQPKTFFDRIAITPATYTNKKGEQCAWKNDKRIAEVADWLEENEGKIIIKADLNAKCHAAAKRLADDSKIAALIGCSDVQVLVTGDYHDEATGLVVPIKCLLDLVPRVGSAYQMSLADLKTARNAGPGAWARVCFDEDYHIQAALYTDLFQAATGEERPDWLHVIVENVHPYEVGRRRLAMDFVDLGRSQYQAALQRYCRCLASGYWPGYDDDKSEGAGWTYAHLEPWMVKRAAGNSLDDLPPEPNREEEKPETKYQDIIP